MLQRHREVERGQISQAQLPVREPSRVFAVHFSPTGLQPRVHLLQQLTTLLRPNPACQIRDEHIDGLSSARTANIESSGDKPLLHPALDEVIHHIQGNQRTGSNRMHGRLPPRPEAHRGLQRRPARSPADQLHRRIDAGRRVEEEPEGARREGADAAEARGVQRRRRLGPRWRLGNPEDA